MSRDDRSKSINDMLRDVNAWSSPYILCMECRPLTTISITNINVTISQSHTKLGVFVIGYVIIITKRGLEITPLAMVWMTNIIRVTL